MAITTVNSTDTFEDWRVKTNTISTNQGDVAALTTTDKTSTVSAINEVNASASALAIVMSIALG